MHPRVPTQRTGGRCHRHDSIRFMIQVQTTYHDCCQTHLAGCWVQAAALTNWAVLHLFVTVKASKPAICFLARRCPCLSKGSTVQGPPQQCWQPSSSRCSRRQHRFRCKCWDRRHRCCICWAIMDPVRHGVKVGVRLLLELGPVHAHQDYLYPLSH